MQRIFDPIQLPFPFQKLSLHGSPKCSKNSPSLTLAFSFDAALVILVRKKNKKGDNIFLTHLKNLFRFRIYLYLVHQSVRRILTLPSFYLICQTLCKQKFYITKLHFCSKQPRDINIRVQTCVKKKKIKRRYAYTM
jgi:hypothetical protein